MIRFHHDKQTASCFAGLRMSAEEFFLLPETEARYELIDGVVFMSPSPSNRHQRIVLELGRQIGNFLIESPIGQVSADVDFELRSDTVYRPDVFVLSAAKALSCGDRITVAPDLIIEVISPQYRSYDSQTKRTDYEAAGVGEYWMVDPEAKTFTFLVLRDGKYVEVQPQGERYASSVLPGFELELDRIRRLF